jgi:hypothetical protein
MINSIRSHSGDVEKTTPEGGYCGCPPAMRIALHVDVIIVGPPVPIVGVEIPLFPLIRGVNLRECNVTPNYPSEDAVSYTAVCV